MPNKGLPGPFEKTSPWHWTRDSMPRAFFAFEMDADRSFPAAGGSKKRGDKAAYLFGRHCFAGANPCQKASQALSKSMRLRGLILGLLGQAAA